nr:2-succinyl-6-hydroxy-2,4-cyclohexadiene-1-carboxylate synthase [Ardenticatena sp.]
MLLEPPWPVERVGSPENPALCFLHGFMGTGEEWRTCANALADDFFCLLPDIPGHGRHRSLPAKRLTFDWLARGLLATLIAHGQMRVFFVGYSLGGRLALYIATMWPYHVRGLVLESASPGLARADERRARARLDDERAARIRRDGLAAFVRTWYTAPLFRGLAANAPLLARVMARRQAQDAEAMARVIADLSPGRMPPLWGALPFLRMPLVFISGALDEKYTAIGEEVCARAPHAVHISVPGASHTVHLEAPQVFIATLREHLAAWVADGL